MIKIITPVDTEPVSLAEVRQHLRLPDEPTEDDLLLNLVKTARAYCENFTRRALAEQTLEMYLDRFSVNSSIMLPCPPLQSVMEIGYKDSTGTETILPASNYIVVTDREPGRVMTVYGMSWPVFTPFPAAPIRIRFVAGYAILPELIRQALLLLVGHWYENREATGTAKDQTAFSVHALLSPYRVEVF
ncbi:MAG: head-tail connector protein [Bacillota bacterium]|nr:head-tail connector protein [Bacillota bacterium]